MPTIRFESTRKGRTFCFVGSLLIGQCYSPARRDSWVVQFYPSAFTMCNYTIEVLTVKDAISALKHAAGTFL